MISSISLINFKAFAELTAPLAPLTVLSGANASGKSTVLQALALIRQSHNANLSGGGAGALVLNGELVELGVGQDLLDRKSVV